MFIFNYLTKALLRVPSNYAEFRRTSPNCWRSEILNLAQTSFNNAGHEGTDVIAAPTNSEFARRVVEDSLPRNSFFEGPAADLDALMAEVNINVGG